MGNQGMQLEDWINIVIILVPIVILYLPHNRKKWTRSITDSNWKLPLAYLILFLLVHYILIKFGAYGREINKWHDVFKDPHSTSIMIGAAIAPAFAILGLLYSNRRYQLASEQISLQTTSMDQQRFYDAVKLLGDEREYLQLGALTAIRQICSKKDTAFFIEARQILRNFLRENTNQNDPGKFASLADSLIPISMIANLAFNTLIDIIYAQQHQKGESEGREQIEDFALVNLRVDPHTKLKSIQFSNCNLRHSIFCGAQLDDVVFYPGHRTATHLDGSPAPGLSYADFTVATFKDCIFHNTEISGATFTLSSGLFEKSLQGCFYSNLNPPKGLPDGLLLRFPYSDEPTQDCTSGELDQFFANNPHFTRHILSEGNRELEIVKIDHSKAVNDDDPSDTLRTIMG